MKAHRFLKITVICLAVLVLFFTVIHLIPPKKNVEENPFLVKDVTDPALLQQVPADYR